MHFIMPPARTALIQTWPGWRFRAGRMDMIDAWISDVDAQMRSAYPPEKLAEMKIRERIRMLVQFRFDAVQEIKEALRSAAGSHGQSAQCHPDHPDFLAHRGPDVAARGRHRD